METKKLKYHFVKASTSAEEDPRMLNNKRMLIDEMVSRRQGVQFFISTIYGWRNGNRNKFFIGFFAAFTSHQDTAGSFLRNIAHDVGLVMKESDKTAKNPLHKRLAEIMKDHENQIIMDFILLCNRWSLEQETTSMVNDPNESVSITLSQTERAVAVAREIPCEPVR